MKSNPSFSVVTALTAGFLLGLATAAAAESRPSRLAPLGPPPIPVDNPQTPEKTALGKLLFFDARLGGDGTTGCVACHEPSAGWAFPDDLSLGYPGTVHKSATLKQITRLHGIQPIVMRASLFISCFSSVRAGIELHRQNYSSHMGKRRDKDSFNGSRDQRRVPSG